MSSKIPELLAPAGNWDALEAAVKGGADAVYFGLNRFNARLRAQNFTIQDLPTMLSFIHGHGLRGYLTLNTLIFNDELRDVQNVLGDVIEAGVDALIVQDLGLCRLIRHLSPDIPLHASTQMSITSVKGIEIAHSLGCSMMTLARECSLREIQQVKAQLVTRGWPLKIEVFVHGALCVSYSGQCHASAALFGRSANRGACAQPCRMPFEMMTDEKKVNLGQRRFLLSLPDLSAFEMIKDLVETGVDCLKIEGRMKSPQYVYQVASLYRQALDRCNDVAQGKGPEVAGRADAGGGNGPEVAGRADAGGGNGPEVAGRADAGGGDHGTDEHYQLAMSFSRGLSGGWLRESDPHLWIHGRYSKKRGVHLGQVTRIQNKYIFLRLLSPLAPGDGIAFEHQCACSDSHNDEVGGRVFTVTGVGDEVCLTLVQQKNDLKSVCIGDRVWKTSDALLERKWRKSLERQEMQFRRPIHLEVWGALDQRLKIRVFDEKGSIVHVESSMPLSLARTQPLTKKRLCDQLGRLGQTPFRLETLKSDIDGNVTLPLRELNRLRRQFSEKLQALWTIPPRWQIISGALCEHIMPVFEAEAELEPQLTVLVRTLEQLEAALACKVNTLYCEFSKTGDYSRALARVHALKQEREKKDPWRTDIFFVPPRMSHDILHSKVDEDLQETLAALEEMAPDGFLARNYDQLYSFISKRSVGDFSLNVANPLTAVLLKERFQLERLTAAYDLGLNQLLSLARHCPASWLEVTIHQAIPLFHMRHCVFSAFLFDAKSERSCKNLCLKKRIALRDRQGKLHRVLRDAGCCNTVYSGTVQSGIEHVTKLRSSGISFFRVELLDESRQRSRQVIELYQKVLSRDMKGSEAWKRLRELCPQGVTRGMFGR